jgi:hypothetical protein
VRSLQAEHYLTFMRGRAWRSSDFTRFSRVTNPGAKAEVSLEGLMGD